MSDRTASYSRFTGGVQLVGRVTKTRHYGLFHRGTSVFECGVTVLYDDHRYFLVETTPEGFLRSLIDKTEFPHIAGNPIPQSYRHPLTAATAKDAIDEATQFLKNRKEPFDEGDPGRNDALALTPSQAKFRLTT